MSSTEESTAGESAAEDVEEQEPAPERERANGSGSEEPATLRAGSTEQTEQPGSAGGRTNRWPDHPRVAVLAYGVALLPFAVAAVALLVSGHGSYIPTADHAMIEARTIDVTQRPPLIGLYSRADWAHPGPLMFYVLAPFHWVTGGSSIATHLGALAINAGSVVGMAVLARRRGGLPLLLITLVANGLLMRTLGAEFLHDPWNTYLPVLPYGLLIFLSWSLACGDRWALPAAVLVASFVAQTHVGFVALGLPLLAWGAFWLVVTSLRARSPERLRALAWPAFVAGALGVAVWLPPLLDALRNTPSNVRRIERWFGNADGGLHTISDGVDVILGQFSLPAEWLMYKQQMTLGGESPFLDEQFRIPWLLFPVVAAALYLLLSPSEDPQAGRGWLRIPVLGRGLYLLLRGSSERRHLVGVVGLTFILGIVGVWRTVGAAFDYRLRWTWVPPMVAFVMAAWAGWLVLARWRPAGSRRWLTAAAVGVLIALSSVNMVTAAQGGNPYEADSEVVGTLGERVLESLPAGDGVVLVTEPYHHAAWYSRGLVLYLEHQGVDVRVEPSLMLHFGAHRVYEGEPLRAKLVVMVDGGIDVMRDRPGLSVAAAWASEHADLWEAERDDREALNRAYGTGEIDEDEYMVRSSQLTTPQIEAIHYRVTVFLEEEREDAGT